LSSSFERDLLTYIGTRFRPRVALLLPLVLVLFALRERIINPRECIFAFVLAQLLVFELRLWDDLSDRERDRHRHPERLLCQRESVRPFVVLLGLLLLFNISLVAVVLPWQSLMTLVALHVALAVWYAVRPLAGWGPVLNYHLILLKYPAIVVALGAQAHFEGAHMETARNWTPVCVSAALIYLMLCIHEVVHDVSLHTVPLARVCLLVEVLFLAVVGCLAVLLAGWLHFS